MPFGALLIVLLIFAVYAFGQAFVLARRGKGSFAAYALGWILLGGLSFWFISFPSSSLWALLVTAPAILVAVLTVAFFTYKPFGRFARVIRKSGTRKSGTDPK